MSPAIVRAAASFMPAMPPADRPCEGSAYHGALHYDGWVRWQKESWHVSYASSPYVEATGALRGRWVASRLCAASLSH